MITETKRWAFSVTLRVIYQVGREWAAHRAHQVLQVGRGVLALLAYPVNLGVVVGHSKNWQRTSMLNKLLQPTVKPSYLFGMASPFYAKKALRFGCC